MKVLATGLSGLYSSLPTKLDVPSEDWHCLHREDWQQLPALVQFLNSLEFCNAVIQVCASAASFLLHLCFIYSKRCTVQLLEGHFLKEFSSSIGLFQGCLIWTIPKFSPETGLDTPGL